MRSGLPLTKICPAAVQASDSEESFDAAEAQIVIHGVCAGRTAIGASQKIIGAEPSTAARYLELLTVVL